MFGLDGSGYNKINFSACGRKWDNKCLVDSRSLEGSARISVSRQTSRGKCQSFGPSSDGPFSPSGFDRQLPVARVRRPRRGHALVCEFESQNHVLEQHGLRNVRIPRDCREPFLSGSLHVPVHADGIDQRAPWSTSGRHARRLPTCTVKLRATRRLDGNVCQRVLARTCQLPERTHSSGSVVS